MAVSLGIYYDSDTPMLCNEQCYTVIKGAEFREVSLVYHAGFPVATIEAYEKLLKNKAMEAMKGEPNINPEKANEVSARYKYYARLFFEGTWYPETPTTDEIFGITAYMLDLDNVVFDRSYSIPYFTHMKVRLQDWKHSETVDTVDWMRYLNVRLSKKGLNIGGFIQQGPFHYQNKLFMDEKMIDTMKEIYNE